MVVGENLGDMAGAVGGCEQPNTGAAGGPVAAAPLQQQPPPLPNINNIMGGMEGTAGVRLHNHRKKLKQRFDIVKKLGQGTYGKVQLGINKETGQEVAIKTIKKVKIETEADLIRIRREIQIMSSVQHPNIIHIYEVFENREKMVLVMEYAAGGELYDYLSERKVLAETEARRIFRQISTAVYYCHKHKICHRDLKLENILLDENGNAKIADFGLSNVFDETRLLSTFCGSPLYASPEIVRGTPYHGPEVDCWSLGVLLYTLVYGAMPFDGSNFKRLVKQISQGDYFEPKKPSPASPLIRAILTVNPRRRADIEAICSHWWVNEGYEGSGDGVPSCLEEAEELASRTPVRLDLLLSLVPPPAPGNGSLVVGAEAPVDGTVPNIEAAVTGVPDMGNGDVVCQPVPPRSHSVGSFMDLEYHGTPSRMPAFVPPERRPKVGGHVPEKEAPQKRKLEGGSASGVCVPKRIDEEGRKEEEEEAEKVRGATSMGVSGVLKEEEEDELKAEEEQHVVSEPAVPQGPSVPVTSNEIESMEVDDVAGDGETQDNKTISEEPVKEDIGDNIADSGERTVSEAVKEEPSPTVGDEALPQPVTSAADVETETQVASAEVTSAPDSEKVISVLKTEEDKVCEVSGEVSLGEEKDSKKDSKGVEEAKERNEVDEGKRKAEEEEEEAKRKVDAEEEKKKDEEKKAAKALARKRLSLKIPKKMSAPTPAAPEVPPVVAAPLIAEGSKVPEGKVSEVKQDSVPLSPKDVSKPVAPKTERRRSQAFERFNSLVAGSSPSPDSPTADKPKKVFIPGIKVSDAKKAFEKKTTNATAAVKVNKPTSAKIIPPAFQNKVDIVPSFIKKKSDDSMKKDSPVKSPKEKESPEPVVNNVNGSQGNEAMPNVANEKIAPAQAVKKSSKEDSITTPPMEKVIADKSPVEIKAAKVNKVKTGDERPVQINSAPPKTEPTQFNQESMENIPQGASTQTEAGEKVSENGPVSSTAVSRESPVIENPPVWSKSATLPRRTSQPKLRGVPVPFGQHQPQYVPAPQPQKKPDEDMKRELPIPQQPPAPEPNPPQESSAPCQYSTAVEYTLKPELEGFPGELSFTISQGMPDAAANKIEQKPVTEAVPPIRRVGRPITRHPTAPATFLRSSSLGPTPRSSGLVPSRGVERIIPIKMEKDEESESATASRSASQTTTTEDSSTPTLNNSATPSQRPPLYPQGSRFGPKGESLSRQSTQESDSGDTGTPVPGPEPIRKSPREFIIPIAVEGGGYVTPRAGSLEPTGADERQNSTDPWHQFHSRTSRLGRNKRMSLRSESAASEDENSISSPPPSFNGNPFDEENISSVPSSATTPGGPRPFPMHRLRSSRPNRRLLEHSDSFSSAEEDDDDGFEILTAESLFSTLLSRVRSLTQRLNVDDGTSSAGGAGLSNRSSHIFPTSSRLLSGSGLHHHGTTHHLGSLGSNPVSSGLSSGSLFSSPSSFRSPHTQSSSSGLMDWPSLHNSRAAESLSRRLSDASRFSDPSRYSRSMSGGGISPGGYTSSSTNAGTAPWRRTTSRDGSFDGDKGSAGSWRSTETRLDDSPSGNSLGTFVARGSDSGEQDERRGERLQERRGRPSFTSRFTPSLAKRMQCQQDPSQSSHPLPPSSSSSSLSSSSSHQQHRLIGPPPIPSLLPKAGKDMLRNETLGDAQGHSYYSKQNTPTAPMSLSEDELPSRYGRRLGRQSSWAETERRPSSYYDGLRTPDSDRREERMASLEALRKRREIPVSVRTRSSSLGRDQSSILNNGMELKGNDEMPTTKATRNILDLSSRSSSVTRDASVESSERSRRGNSSYLESLEGSERSQRGTSSINESLESSDRSRRGTSSINESRSNSPDRSILDKFLHMKDRREASMAARERRRNVSKGESDWIEADGVVKDDKSHCSRPQSLNLPGSLAQSWNGDPYIGDFKDEGSPKEVTDGESSSKKKGHRISRFLRPDFFDTPREESIFAKKKDLESDANAENDRKLKEQQPAKSGFLHSLEKRLDKLRGGEKSRKVNSLEVESSVHGVEGSAVVPECLTSTKMAAEVRKAKSIGPEDVINPDGTKRGFGSSRVDRAINSLLQREKVKGKKEVSESGLIKRAVGMHERACPSKSRSSGELSLFSVNSGPSLGKLLTTQKNSASPSGGEMPINGMGTETTAGGKFSSKMNSMLGIFRRNEVDVTPPVNQNKRVRRTQSLAYDKTVPDDILSAISGYDSLNKSNVVVYNEIADTEPKPSLALPENTSLKAVSKVEKVKKSSKAAKEKSNVAKSKNSQQKEKKIASGKLDKASDESSKEAGHEKSSLPILGKKDIKKDKISAPVSKNNSYDVTITLPKPTKKDTLVNNDIPIKNNSIQNPESHSLIIAPINSSEKFDNEGSSKSLDCFKKKLHINPMNETKVEGKELDYKEPLQNLYSKQLDRTATQDSLDSSWSACSDGGVVVDMVGEGRKISRYHDGLGFGESMDSATPPLNHHLRSPSPIGADNCGGEKGSWRIDVDDDSEESVGDRIRRKSFYCRFNEVPSRRKSRKSSASSLLYSASDLWNTLESKSDSRRHKSHRKPSGGVRSSSSASSGSALEGNSLDSSLLQLGYRTSAESKMAESISSDSRCSFSPPPLLTKPSAAIYRRSSTSPYQDRLPPPDSVLHSNLNSKGLRPASSASSLGKSNSSNLTSVTDEESTSLGLRRGGEGGYASYIPSPLSPSSSMSNSYHNGVIPSLSNETSLELDRKGHRMRKFGVPSLADGITAPSPTHRKYSNSAHSSSDGLVPSVVGGSVSGPSSLQSEMTPQAVINASSADLLPPMGVSNKMRMMRNSLGQN